MLPKTHQFLPALFSLTIASQAQAITLTSTQTNFITSSDITTSGVGINSALVGTSSSPDKIKNLHIITTGNSGATSSAYGIKTTGNYNQITNALGASIYTTGSSGRGVSIANLSSAANLGSINTQSSSSYGIYGGGDNNAISNSGSITTLGGSSYGIYLNGSNNSANNSGAIISAQAYGIYGNGNANQISNSGNITTTSGSSAHGIYVSAGTDSAASASSFSSVNNSGIIDSNANGIYVKDNFTQITNSGTINAGADASLYGINNEGDNSIITNSGDITATTYAIRNSGAGVIINNSGNLHGGVKIGEGTLNIFSGTISGNIDGGGGVGSVNIEGNFSQNSSFSGLDNLNINSGSSLNSYNNIAANNIFIAANSTLILNSGSSLSGAIKGFTDGAGTLTISAIDFVPTSTIGENNHALANLNITDGASLTTSSDIYSANIFLDGELNFFTTNDLTIFGNISGSGAGKIDVGNNSQNISGNFSLSSGDILAVNFSNNKIGNLAIGGVANIADDSKLQVTFNSNNDYVASGTKFAVISAENSSAINVISDKNIAVNGHDSNIFGLLKFTTSSADNKLFLQLNRLAAEEVTSNKNAQNIYRALDKIGDSSQGKLRQFQSYLDSTNLSSAGFAQALNQLAPQSSKASLGATSNLVNNSVKIDEKRLDKMRLGASHKEGFFAQALGSSATQNEVKDDEGFRANSIGLAIGLDREFAEKEFAGASISYARSNVKSLDDAKVNMIDSYQLNFFASKNFGKYFLDGISGFAWHQYHSNRAITALKESAGASYSGQTYLAKIKGGFVENFHYGLKLIPEISLNFLHNKISAYSENGGDELNLKVGGVAANFLEGRAGLNLGWLTKVSDIPEIKKIDLLLKTSYGYSFINEAPSTVSSFSGSDVTFQSKITNLDRQSLKLGFEIDAFHADDVIFAVDYSYEKRATYQSHFLVAKVTQEF